MANIFERKADRGGGGTKKVVVGKGLQKQREMHLCILDISIRNFEQPPVKAGQVQLPRPPLLA
jgi:hypothetical protein